MQPESFNGGTHYFSIHGCKLGFEVDSAASVSFPDSWCSCLKEIRRHVKCMGRKRDVLATRETVENVARQMFK